MAGSCVVLAHSQSSTASVGIAGVLRRGHSQMSRHYLQQCRYLANMHALKGCNKRVEQRTHGGLLESRSVPQRAIT